MIHLICALKCEAMPIIRHYRLKRLDKGGIFPVYLDTTSSLSLVITGLGKINAVAGASYVHGLFNTQQSDGWLNIGIAGHKTLAIGQAVLAHRIQDHASDQVFYPQFVFEPPCPTAGLLTLDKPSANYAENMFDMEATGFYATASRFATSELIHVLKIISDNEEHPAFKLNESFVEGLIGNHVETIGFLLDELRPLSLELEAIQKIPEYYPQFIERWHFTRYERGTLAQLLNRWSILCPDRDPMEQIETIHHGKEVLAILSRQLETLPIRLSARAT